MFSDQPGRAFGGRCLSNAVKRVENLTICCKSPPLFKTLISLGTLQASSDSIVYYLQVLLGSCGLTDSQSLVLSVCVVLGDIWSQQQCPWLLS